MTAMPAVRAIPHATQRNEAWANGNGSTSVILREPDDPDWLIRVSVAKVERAGPFSELPDTRRTLVPLDAAMTLRFPDGNEMHAVRFGQLRFDGSPAPAGQLPEGPTRDFNLMLRGDAHGEVLARTLVDSMVLPLEPAVRWLVYLDSGRAQVHAGTDTSLALNPHDAALIAADAETGRAWIEGAGEIVLVKLQA
ncbi:MAG TPA: HutD family protein [Rhodanobacteraceae bacterium]|nr:HutD family protein [Rhodanobacteraceae bacterium]